MICVAWSSWSGTPGRFGSPGWAEAGLEGRRSSWAGSFWTCSLCIPKAGGRWCGARVEKPRFLAGIPVECFFTILCCILSMPYPDKRVSEARSSWLACPPGDTCAPPSCSAKRFPRAILWARAGRGLLASRRCMPGSFALPSPPASGRMGTVAMFHPSLSELLCCQWLPEARCLWHRHPPLL